MPLGDSLTSGVSTFPVIGAYRNRLHTLLSNAGYNVDFVGTFTDASNPTLPDTNHQGQGSARIDQIQANIQGWLNATEDPDVVLLLIGTNDFWQNYQLGSVQTRLTNLIADIATKRPFAKIILSTLPPRTDNAAIEAQQVSFNAALPGIVAQQVALGRQVSLVDMHAGLSAADIDGDGVHPSQSGFDKMATVWFPSITSVISPQGTSNPPVIAKISPITSPTQVSVVFSKPVADSSANVANFSLSGGLTVSNAALDSATKRIVTLTTSAQTPGIVYTVSVSGVKDRTAQQNQIAPGSMATFSSSALANGSFESDLAGWTTTGNYELKSGAPYTSTDGAKILAFNTGQSTPNGTASQTFATTVGQPYQLNFDVGAFGYNTSQQRMLVTVQGSTQLVSDTTTVTCPNGGLTTWVPKSYNFVANSPTTTVTFTDTSTTSNSLDLVLDNVRVGAQTTRYLAVTSLPTAGAAMTITPVDTAGNGNGSTSLIRTYANGTAVTVTAPASFAGDNFLRWQKNGVNLAGSTPSLNVTMDGDHSLTAVYGSNSAPVANPDAYAVSANTQLVVPTTGVLTNDSDPEGGAITAVLNAAPASGTLVLNANGSFTYTPNSGFTGTDSFTYHAYDGVSDSNIVTVSITVSSSNSQLIVNGSFESSLTGWTNSGNMLIQSGAPYVPTNGTKLLAFNAAQLAPNGVISQAFPTTSGQTYQLTFDVGVLAYNTNAQSIRVAVNGTASLLTQNITVTGLGNGATRWVPQTFSFVADSATTTLSFTDTSTTTNSLDLVLDNVRVSGATANRTLTVSSSPSSGVAVGISPPDRNAAAGGTTTFTRSYTDGTIVNLIAPAFSGTSAFQKWQKNGTDIANTRAASVTVDADMTLTAFYGANTAPVAVADNYSTPLNTVLTIPATGVLGNDTDADLNPITAVLNAGPSNGNLALNPNGGFTYTPNTGFTGTDSFTYHANDGAADSNVVTVNIVVIGGGPNLLANGGFEAGETGWTITGSRFVIDSTPPYIPSEGTKLAVLNGGNQNPDAVFSQTFATTSGQTYLLSFDVGVIGINTNEQKLGVSLDGASSLFSSTESLFSNGTNTAVWTTKSYVFTANSATTTLTFTDLSASTGGIDLLLDNVRVNGSGAASAHVLTVASTPASGVGITVSPADNSSNSNGTTQFLRTYDTGTVVTLTAPASFGTDNFAKWQLDGSDLTTSTTANVTMDAPHALTAVYQAAPVIPAFTNGSFESDEAGWTITGNRIVLETTPPYIPYAGNKMMIFNGANSTPNAVVSQTFATTPGNRYILAFEVGTLGINTNPQSLGVNLAGAAALVTQTETLPGNGAGTASWASKSYAFTADSAATTLTFTDLSTSTNGIDLLLDNVRISPMRTLTVASSPATGVSVTVSPNDADNNGNGTTQFVRTYADGATVNLTAPAINGASSFLKWTKNGVDFANTAATTVTLDANITMTAVYATNTAPVAVADNYSTAYQTQLVVAASGVLGNDTDGESNPLTAVVDTNPSHGNLTLNPNGGFTYTPENGYSGSDSFTYHANDGGLDSNIVTVTITVGVPNLIVNGGFESGETGWTITGNRFVIDSTPPYVPSEGSKFAVLNGGDSQPTAVFSQTFPTVAGTSYLLKFDIGILALNTAQQRLTVALTGNTTLFTQDEYLTGNGTGTSVWAPRTYAFTADSATTTVSFTDNSVTTSQVDLMLDNVRVNVGLARTLTVAASPAAAVAITVSPADINGSGNGTTQFSRAYDDGAVVTLTAPSTSGSTSFSKWQKNGADLTTNASATVTMDANYTLTAVYEPIVIAPGSLVNGSFEQDFNGWTKTGNVFIESASPYTATNGTKLASFNGGNQTPNGVVSQTITTTPGATYTLAFDAGVLAFNTNPQVLKVALTGSGSLLSQNITINGLGNGTTRWVPQSFTFTANSATTTLSFTDLSASTGGLDLVLDNVRITLNGAVTTRTLTVNSTPATGAAITVSPADNGSNANGTTNFTRTYNDGAAVTLTAPATFGGNNFSKWQKGGVDLTTSTTANVTMDADYTLTAVYVAPPVAGSFVNGSFESDFTGWTVTGAAFIESASPYSATNGTKLASFNGGNQAPSGVVSQAFTTTVGTSYTLAFDAGVLAYNTNPQVLKVAVAGGSPLLSQNITINGLGNGTTRWVPQSFTFVADSTTTTLSFSDLSASTIGLDLVLDNVRITTGGAATTRTLTVNSTPATGAAITVSPADNGSNANGTTNFTRTYNSGASVTLTAPANFGGNNFSKWQKGGVDLTTNTTANVTMDADYTLTAVYVTPPPTGSNLIVNGSFESDFSNWTQSGSNRIENPGPSFSTDGSKILSYGVGNTPTDGTVSQSFTTVPGTNYQLNFDLGALGVVDINQTIRVKIDGAGTILNQTTSVLGRADFVMVWAAKAFTFTANSTTTTLTLSDASSTSIAMDMFVDNVRVTAGGAGGGGGGGGTTSVLTVNSTPNTGAVVTVSPVDNSSQGNGATNFTRTYNNGTAVTLVAPYANFVKWLKDGAWYATDPTTTVTVDAARTMTAVYTDTPVLGPFTNGSFEQEFTGWTWSGSQQTVKVKTGLPATDGATVIEFNSNNSANDGSITQTFTTTAGTTYTVNFDMGVLAYNTSAQSLQVTATGSGSLLSQTFTMNGIGSGNVAWSAKTVTFTANSATTTLTFRDQSSTGLGLDLLLDNVRVSAGGGGGGGGGGSGTTSVLTVNSTPNTGAVVAVSPVDNSSQGNGSTNFTRTYNNGTAVTLVAPYANFVKWLKDGAWYATNPTTTVTVDAAHTMTAVYTSTPVLGPFTNGSFEQEFTGWTWSGSQQSVKVKDGLPSTDGLNVIEFNSNNSANDGSITQTFTTTVGTTYTVNFDMGVLAYNTNAQALQVTATGAGSLVSQTFSLNGIGSGNVVWSAKSVSFTANSATTTLTFRDQSTTGLGLDLLLDNVRVSSGGSTGGGGGGTVGSNLILNGSFESDLANWTQSGSNRIEWPGPSYSTDGAKILSYGVGNTPTDGSVSQSFATAPGTTYRINFDLGALGVVDIDQIIRVKVDGAGTLLNQTTSVRGRADFVMVWAAKEFTFTANSTTTTLTLSDASSTSIAMDMFVDNVRVFALAPASMPVPVFPEETAPLSSVAPETAVTPDSIPAPTFSGTPGAYRIGLNATEAGRYFLERSEDLQSWNFHSEIQVTEPGPIEFQDNETGHSRMFYRIGKETDTGN